MPLPLTHELRLIEQRLRLAHKELTSEAPPRVNISAKDLGVAIDKLAEVILAEEHKLESAKLAAAVPQLEEDAEEKTDHLDWAFRCVNTISDIFAGQHFNAELKTIQAAIRLGQLQEYLAHAIREEGGEPPGAHLLEALEERQFSEKKVTHRALYEILKEHTCPVRFDARTLEKVRREASNPDASSEPASSQPSQTAEAS